MTIYYLIVLPDSDFAQQLVEEYCIHSICEITSSVQSTHPEDAKHFNIKLQSQMLAHADNLQRSSWNIL